MIIEEAIIYIYIYIYIYICVYDAVICTEGSILLCCRQVQEAATHTQGSILDCCRQAKEAVTHTHASIVHCCRQVKEAIPVPLTGLQDALRSSQARGLASQLPRPEVLLQRWVCQCFAQAAVLSALSSRPEDLAGQQTSA